MSRVLTFAVIVGLLACSPEDATTTDGGSDDAGIAADGGCAELEKLSLCLVGVKKCDGSSLLECTDCGRSWDVVETCPGSCREGACVSPVCVPGTLRCNVDQIVRCASDGLAEVAEEICALGCDESVAGALSCRVCTCAPGASRCMDGTNSREFCSTDCLSWLVEECGAETCTESSDAFAGATCGPSEPVCSCTPGAARCSASGDERVSCTAECFEATETCAYGCAVVTADSGGLVARCRVCEPNSVSCSGVGEQKLTCNADGSATTSEPCVGPCIEDATGVTCVPRACVPETRRCVDDALYACLPDGSADVLETLCSSGCVVDPSATGGARCRPCSCVPGFRRCAGGTNAVEWCSEDCTSMQGPLPCPEGTTCNQGVCVAPG